WMLDEEAGDLVLAAAAGELARSDQVGLRRPATLNNLSQSVLGSGRVYQTSDVEADPRWANHGVTDRLGLRTYLGVPLVVGEQRYGILTLLFREARTFGTDDIELVETVAAQTAAALANARAYDRLATLTEISRLLVGSLE